MQICVCSHFEKKNTCLSWTVWFAVASYVIAFIAYILEKNPAMEFISKWQKSNQRKHFDKKNAGIVSGTVWISIIIIASILEENPAMEVISKW